MRGGSVGGLGDLPSGLEGGGHGLGAGDTAPLLNAAGSLAGGGHDGGAVVLTGDDEGASAGAELHKGTGAEHAGRDLGAGVEAGAVDAGPGYGAVGHRFGLVLGDLMLDNSHKVGCRSILKYKVGSKI